jgi:hypothetical protein
MKPHPTNRSARGFTVLELVIGATILLVLVGTLAEALGVLRRGTAYEGVDSDLQTQAERALHTIIANLKPSGLANVAGNPFPYLFDDGNATGAYAASAHAPATHAAKAGDSDFGPTREIVFVQPADADGDGRPDLDVGGNLVWGASQLSFVLVTRADGVNVLQRRVDGGSPRDIANHLERVTFDDNASSGFVVPLRAIRVRLWFRKKDERGTLHKYFAEAEVKLRNG